MKQNKMPDWYWSRGLHDANIILATKNESDLYPNINCLILKIDCDDAMFETDIKEIRFYNFKIINGCSDINLLNGGWWLSDELYNKGQHFLLELKFDTAECKRKRLEMTFERAEVVRE